MYCNLTVLTTRGNYIYTLESFCQCVPVVPLGLMSLRTFVGCVALSVYSLVFLVVFIALFIYFFSLNYLV